jgi:hypothetical protein
MLSSDFWLPLLHLGATLGWSAASLALLIRPDGALPARLQDWAAATLAAFTMPLLDHGGWWVDMPGRYMVPALAALGLALALFGSARLPGRLTALLLGAFFLTLGLVSTVARCKASLSGKPCCSALRFCCCPGRARSGRAQASFSCCWWQALSSDCTGPARLTQEGRPGALPGRPLEPSNGGAGQTGLGAMIISICRPSMRGSCSIFA